MIRFCIINAQQIWKIYWSEKSPSFHFKCYHQIDIYILDICYVWYAFKLQHTSSLCTYTFLYEMFILSTLLVLIYKEARTSIFIMKHLSIKRSMPAKNLLRKDRVYWSLSSSLLLFSFTISVGCNSGRGNIYLCIVDIIKLIISTLSVSIEIFSLYKIFSIRMIYSWHVIIVHQKYEFFGELNNYFRLLKLFYLTVVLSNGFYSFFVLVRFKLFY